MSACKSVQECTRVYKSVQGCARVCKSVQGCARVCVKACVSMQGYIIYEDVCVCVCDRLRVCVHVCTYVSMQEYMYSRCQCQTLCN